MRIAFITQWFPPEVGSLIPESIAVGLAERGHDVHVLTAFPNYPTGEIYPGWRQQPYLRETHSLGVTVHRTPVYATHDRNAVRRAANYLSHAATATLGTLRVPRPDVWLVYSSPATSALPAQLAPPAKRAPVCLLIQDLWPDSVTGSGMVPGRVGHLIEHVLSAYTRFSYRHAARIGVTSPGIREILQARGVPQHKIAWTPNWLTHPPLPDESGDGPVLGSGQRTFLYAGNLGAMQGLHELVDAFALVPEADLVLMGHGVERESLVRQAQGYSNVTVLPPVPHEMAGRYLAAADVLVVSLRDSPLLRATMPSKVQAYLRAGKPILAHASGDVASIVTQHGIGASCTPGDVTDTIGAIHQLTSTTPEGLVAMGAAARMTYESSFTMEIGVCRLEALLIEAQEAWAQEHSNRRDGGRSRRSTAPRRSSRGPYPPEGGKHARRSDADGAEREMMSEVRRGRWLSTRTGMTR
ncbi:MAG: glycosyltransferase family 4 protein [Dermatophilaceae bacterium]